MDKNFFCIILVRFFILLFNFVGDRYWEFGVVFLVFMFFDGWGVFLFEVLFGNLFWEIWFWEFVLWFVFELGIFFCVFCGFFFLFFDFVFWGEINLYVIVK